MKRRIALLLGAAMLSTVALFASPASATVGTTVCAGTGSATLSDGLFYPNGPSKLVSFSFSFSTGVCADGKTFSASGHVHGWCGHSTGSGSTSNGARFHFISAGGMLVVFGHLVGGVNATPAIGTSCTTGAASFLITGAVALQGVVLPADGCAGLPATWNCL